MGGGSSKAPSHKGHHGHKKIAISQQSNQSTSKGIASSKSVDALPSTKGRLEQMRSINAMESFRRKRLHLNDGPDSDEEEENGAISTETGLLIEPHTKSILASALIRTLHLDTTIQSFSIMLDTIMRCLEFNIYSKGDPLFSLSEPATRLYIIESGRVQLISDNGTQSFVEAGDTIGEMSMYFEHVQRATAVAFSSCKIWMLKRVDFRKIQKRAAADTHIHRVMRLSSVPLLRDTLTSNNISELASSLVKDVFAPSHPVYSAGSLVDKIMLIERGELRITIPEDYTSWSDAEVLTKLGVHVPKSDSNESFKGVAGKCERKDGMLCIEEGSVIGLGILLGKAHRMHGWPWIELVSSAESKSGDTMQQGAQCPTDFMAQTSLAVSYINVKKFERLFGDCLELLTGAGIQEEGTEDSSSKASVAARDTFGNKFAPITLSAGDFSSIEIIRSVHMGTVAVGYTAGEVQNRKKYLLKILSKQAVVSEKQKKHVLEEASVLSTVDHKFMVHLHDKFQTPDNLVYVFDYLPGGDLWYLLYGDSHRGDTVLASTGLPLDCVRFYTASLVSVLGHLRTQSIAFRNLKPENVMLDAKGYVKLIGFGIAKKIPYKSVVAESESYRFLYKTYTLCGTLEYMAPEMLFSKGHDHNVDKWALGVMIFEMITGRTPFGASLQADVAANISRVASKGFDISPEDASLLTPEACRFIKRLICAEPANRASLRYNDNTGAFGDPFFTRVGFDWEALNNGSMKPPFNPTSYNLSDIHNVHGHLTTPREPPGNLLVTGMPGHQPFTGPSNAFKQF